MKNELSDKLNRNNLFPEVKKGKVTLVKETDEYGTTESVSLDALEAKEAYVEPHPEGADRGGYVPFVEDVKSQKAYWMENDGEWHGA